MPCAVLINHPVVFLFQLSLRGLPGPLGLAGRPGPLVRHSSDLDLFCLIPHRLLQPFTFTSHCVWPSTSFTLSFPSEPHHHARSVRSNCCDCEIAAGLQKWSDLCGYVYLYLHNRTFIFSLFDAKFEERVELLLHTMSCLNNTCFDFAGCCRSHWAQRKQRRQRPYCKTRQYYFQSYRSFFLPHFNIFIYLSCSLSFLI